MKSKLKYSAFALGAIILVLACLEGGARLYRWVKQKQMQNPGKAALAFSVNDLAPYVFYRQLPVLEMRPDDQYSFAFDGQTVNARKSPGEYRIFIMGGSVAQGYGASAPEKKYYRLFENLLNENNPDKGGKNFKVVSAGRLGYVSAQDLIFLLMGTLDFSPDLVIFLNGVNDVMTVTQYNEPPGHPFFFHTLKKAVAAAKLDKELEEALKQSALLTEISAMAKKYKVPVDNDLTSQNIVRHYRRNMTQAAQILNANKVPAILILQPTIHRKKHQSQQEMRFLNRTPWETRNLWETAYPEFAESLKSISQTGKTDWADFRSVFDETAETIFIDSVHFNDMGQEIIAKALFDKTKASVYGN